MDDSIRVHRKYKMGSENKRIIQLNTFKDSRQIGS